MSDDEAFTRAILAAPRDDALRRVYADWLEERGDARAEYLRLLLAAQEAPEHRARLAELRRSLDPLWIGIMDRGRPGNPCDQSTAITPPRRERQRNRRQATESDVSLFLRQYARKAPKAGEPNDRRYSRQVEQLVKRLKPEELDRLIRGDDGQ